MQEIQSQISQAWVKSSPDVCYLIAPKLSTDCYDTPVTKQTVQPVRSFEAASDKYSTAHPLL